MQEPVGIAGESLKRVSERMAEVEQGAGAALLALVGLNDRRLGLDARGDGRGARVSLAGKNLRPGLLEPGEEGRMSASTRLGWWKVPIRFLPWAVSMPVLPPTEEST
jgi:hypothetical protein